MEQLILSKWLKIITIGTGLIGAVVYFLIIPMWGNDTAREYTEFAYYYLPWLVFIWITAIPCYLSLFQFWSICTEIGKDNSFSNKNANSLKRISQYLVIEVVILFSGNLILYIMGMNHPGIVIIMLFIIFIGIAIAVLSAALSHLVLKACKLKEENDMTI